MECFATNRFFGDISQLIIGIFAETGYPWEALPLINAYLNRITNDLPDVEFINHGDSIYIHKTAKIAQSVLIEGPAVICGNAELRHNAFIRGNVFIGSGCVVGNSSEIKNSILLDKAQAPHFNYVGDSILGFRAHIGAGVILSNLKSDQSDVIVRYNGGFIDTKLRKFGAVIGDHAEIGCNSVLNPGSVIGRDTTVYPLSSVRGYVPEHCIYKSNGDIVVKK